VNWVIAAGAPMKLGTMDPDALPFSSYKKGITCAEVIKLMFRIEPDFVVDWDYSTLPLPTIHFRKTKSLTPILINLTDATIREHVNVKERPDWQRSYVKINYDQVNTNSSGQFVTLFADWYSALGQGNSSNGAAYTIAEGAALPADVESKFRGVDLFVDLQGFVSSGGSQAASFASIPFDHTDINQWVKWKPDLIDPKTTATRILNSEASPIVMASDGKTIQYPALPAADGTKYSLPAIATRDELDNSGANIEYNPECIYELVDGEWADWIPGIVGQRVRASCTVQLFKKNGAVSYKTLHHDMTVVNYNTAGISKNFVLPFAGASQNAEDVPAGLAKSMWTSWRNLAIEGSFTNVESVIGNSLALSRSNSLNFLTTNPGENGKPDWRAVNALVQRISGDIARGLQNVGFGAPLRITGHDLVDAMRATRYRMAPIDLGYLFGGPLGGGGQMAVKFARKTHSRSSQHGASHSEKLVVSQDPSQLPTDTHFTADPISGQITFA